MPNYNTYGLSPQFLESLNILGPLTSRCFVANLDYKVTAKKLEEIFHIAGKVVDAELKTDKEGNSKGFGTVTFQHPVEAVQAISMLHGQKLYGRGLSVRMYRPDKEEEEAISSLPSGLSGIGKGLGAGGQAIDIKNLSRYTGGGVGNDSVSSMGGMSGGGNMGGMMNMGGMGGGMNNMGPSTMGGGGLGGMGMGHMAMNTERNFMSSGMGGHSGMGMGSSAGTMGMGMGTAAGTMGMGMGSTAMMSAGMSSAGMGNMGGMGSLNTSLGSAGITSPGMGTSGMGSSGMGSTGMGGSSMGGVGMGMGSLTGGSSGMSGGGGGMGGSGGFGDYDRGSYVGNSSSNSYSRSSDTIIVRNVPSSFSWQDLRDRFKEVGDVCYTEMKSRGSALVRFTSERDAQRAIDRMNGIRIDGRSLEVSFY